jgi:hypothetical protein
MTCVRYLFSPIAGAAPLIGVLSFEMGPEQPPTHRRASGSSPTAQELALSIVRFSRLRGAPCRRAAAPTSGIRTS